MQVCDGGGSSHPHTHVICSAFAETLNDPSVHFIVNFCLPYNLTDNILSSAFAETLNNTSVV
jgi:hypothetical protein